MSAKSSIEWCDATWNPVRGCSKVSPGCKNCYAETFSERWRGIKGHPFEQGFDLRLVPEKLAEPLRWKKPRRIFVNSMSDLFHEDVHDEYIAVVFAVMAACPQHTFQVLTKRAERMGRWFMWMTESGYALCVAQRQPWPLPNVWLGVSVEDQQRAAERIPHLLSVPAALRFLSCEPLLGPVDLRPWLGNVVGFEGTPGRPGVDAFTVRPGTGWVIVGGESGPGARPFDLEWARGIVSQCKSARVPVFVKQVGAAPVSSDTGDYLGRKQFMWQSGLAQRLAIRLNDRKGGDTAEWPEDIRVRQFPQNPNSVSELGETGGER